MGQNAKSGRRKVSRTSGPVAATENNLDLPGDSPPSSQSRIGGFPARITASRGFCHRSFPLVCSPCHAFPQFSPGRSQSCLWPRALAGDWPQILGPDRSGVAAADEKLADSWPPEGPKVVWGEAGRLRLCGSRDRRHAGIPVPPSGRCRCPRGLQPADGRDPLEGGGAHHVQPIRWLRGRPALRPHRDEGSCRHLQPPGAADRA